MTNTITLSRPRQSVQVTFPDGRVYAGPPKTPIWEFVKQAEADANTPPSQQMMAVKFHNRLRELTHRLDHDIHVQPVTLQDPDGIRIYRRSLSFLLIAAAHAVFPKARVFIDHSLPQRAYYGHVEDHPSFSASDLQRLEAKMRDMVKQDLPIQRHQMDLDDAIRYFEERQDAQKIRLLNIRSQNYLRIYRLEDFSDYFFGYMVPSTAYLQWFGLESGADNGFLLRYPDENDPTHIQPIQQASKLHEVFHQTGEWLRLLKVRDIGQLNSQNEAGRMRELMLVAEALHERRIADIAHQIVQASSSIRLVLIAGPSSSGKTTFAKRLAIQLMSHGVRPFTLELDNYFVDREQTPLDEQGEYDFESLYAINLEALNRDLEHLIAGEVVQLPYFDFHQGKSLPGKAVQLSPDQVIILEGIHGLNPSLTHAIERQQTYRIYVSALTQLNIDRYNRISTTDVRLLRRIVRDATHRGWTATDTLMRWQSVGRGERLNIFPFQEEADVMFNSALVYEVAVLKTFAEPHLLRVSQDHPKWIEANRLLSFLSWVKAHDDDPLPDNSILREFIGGSNLRDYHPGI